MIEPKAGTRIWIAAGFTDLRRGFQGLSSIVETVLEQYPFSAMSLSSAAAVAIWSSCCGWMATACVFFRNDWSAAASSGPRPRAARCR